MTTAVQFVVRFWLEKETLLSVEYIIMANSSATSVKVVLLATGSFNPIHCGHINMFGMFLLCYYF